MRDKLFVVSALCVRLLRAFFFSVGYYCCFAAYAAVFGSQNRHTPLLTIVLLE